MPSSRLYHILFTLLILSQLRTALTNTCSTGQYLVTSGSNNLCYDQTIITANIHPTLTSLVYLIVFEGGTSPFTSASDFTGNVQFTLSSTVSTIATPSPPFTVYQVTDDFSVFQVVIAATEVPYDTTMTVVFTDFTTDETRVSSIKSSIDIIFASNEDLSTSDTELVDKITDIDYILEIVWIGVSLLNPYWIIYMDCKLYRETLDIFKQVTVQYEPFMVSFYQANNRRTSGLRAYNLLQRYAFGDSSVESDWKKYGWTSVGLDSIDSDVLDDTQVLVNSQFFQFNDFAIFISTFGSEITVLIACLILALLFEFNFRILKPAAESIYHKISTIARQFFWGLLFMNALGSCQSLIYYAAIQFQGFDSEKTTHSKIGLAIAILAVIFVIGGVCAYVILSSKKKVFVNQMNANPQAGPLTFFDWVLEFYKAEKLYQPAMILMVIVRSILFSVIIITLNEHPVAQTAALLGFTCVFMIGLVLTKPFSRRLYMVFKLIYEFVLVLALVFLLVLASLDNEGSFDSDERSILNVVLISIWIAPPVVTIIFGAVGLIHYVKEARWRTGEKRSVKIAPVNEERKIINKKKVIGDEEQKTVKFEDSPTIVDLPTAAEVKPQQPIFHPVPSSSVKNLEVPPVSILKVAPRNEVMTSNRTDISSSNANLMQNSVTEGNRMPASSLVLDSNPNYAAQRNSMFLPRQQQLANSNVPQGAGTDRLVKNTSTPMPQGERPHIRNNSSNVVENKSLFALGGEQPRVRTAAMLGVPNNRLRYDVMELKLTPQSLRVIDQNGFKEYMSPKEGEGEHFISSRNNINA